MEKLWGGRFQKETSSLMDEFNSSIGFDYKLYHYDIMGSKAHARMLAACGIISTCDRDKILEGIEKIHKEIEDGVFKFSIKNEDIHMNIESRLIDLVGDVGKKLHTARSRNDQVALDTKLYARDMAISLKGLLKEWIGCLIALAKENLDTIMPGYTHLQRAQPVTFAHVLMAYVEMAKRDYLRLKHWLDIHNTMPLGSGALAATTFPIDRLMVAHELGFDGVTMNSLDGVSDRDFSLDLVYIASTGMMHLSRMCEELVIWSSQEFSFVEFDDAYSTGSSMMPQKKNPDIAELVRGKTGRVYGDLIGLLTTMKGLPLAYNKDMQEDKEGLFDSIDTWSMSLSIMTRAMETIKVNKESMLKAANKGFVNATDLADYLVKKGMPFRDAHRVTGEVIFDCISRGCELEDLKVDEYKLYSDMIEEDIYHDISIKTCLEKRNVVGGPNKNQVINHIDLITEEFSL